MARVTDLDQQEEMGLLLFSRGGLEYVGNADEPLGCLLVLPCPIATVNEHMQRPSWPKRIRSSGAQNLRNEGMGHKTCWGDSLARGELKKQSKEGRH